MMLGKIFYRSLRVVEHLLTGAAITVAIRARYGSTESPAWLPTIVQWWHARLCRALGVRIEVSGTQAAGALLVGNHISWLDIPVIGALADIGFLSKAEVRSWPLIGWMAATAGTRFIDRGGNQAEAVVAGLRDDLSAGRTLMIFPEGTTTDGRSVKRFHPRLFAAAQMPGLRIQPVAISYRRTGARAPDAEVPYVGDDSLIANLWRLVRHPGVIASIRFLAPMTLAAGEPRRALAERARAAIVEALGLESDRRPTAARRAEASGRASVSLTSEAA